MIQPPGLERLNLGLERLERGLGRPDIMTGAVMLSLLTRIGVPDWEILEHLTEVLQAHLEDCQDRISEDTLVQAKVNKETVAGMVVNKIT